MTKEQLLKILYAFQHDLREQFFKGGDAPIEETFKVEGKTSLYANSPELEKAIDEAFKEENDK